MIEISFSSSGSTQVYIINKLSDTKPKRATLLLLKARINSIRLSFNKWYILLIIIKYILVL